MTKRKKPDPDAGMLAARPERPPFNLDDYATEEEANAALRARLGPIAYERMSSADGIKAVAAQQATSPNPETCPQCGATDAIPIVWGMPDHEASERINRGEAISGGCMIFGDERDPAFECRACRARSGDYWQRGKGG